MHTPKYLIIPNWLLFILFIILSSLPQTDIGILIQTIFCLLILIWIIKVDEELYLRIKGRPSINLNLLIFCLVASFFYVAFIWLFTDGYEISTEKDNYAEYGWMMYVYLFGSFFVIASLLYGIHFTAYCIHVLEDQYFGQKTDYGYLLVALFFFPIGIWWLQPKINRILRVPLE